VLLAVIGPDWLNASDQNGARRLASQSDYVRLEISAALERDIPVIPVLLDDTKMPDISSLPDDLKPLAKRQALDIRNASFDSDIKKLIDFLHICLSEVRTIAPISIRFSSLSLADMASYNVSEPTINEYFSHEIERHPHMFKRDFSSMPLSMNDLIIVTSFVVSVNVVKIERLLPS
jgi:hypothetical protein